MQYKIIKSIRKTLSIQIKNGEVLVKSPFFISDKKISEFVQKHKNWIEKKLAIIKPKDKEELNLSEAKEFGEKYIIPRAEFLAKMFNKKVKLFKITSAKTRWGSCTSKGNINLSCRLIFTHSKAIDYVIIHELAHLKYMNHSQKFWQHVEEMMSDYKVWHKELKRKID